MRTIPCLFAGLALAVSAAPAIAQQACMPRDSAVSHLEQRYEEAVAGRGLAADGALMIEILVSESGSWTVLASDSAGRSCIIATGESWEYVPALIGDPA